ncbi:metal ABC transporter permease [Salinicola acroporae]|uniref:Metal ABC transporter permease n=1 Tax=Salinicola acroporae TaxID=1541440 RepID=A0ABT6I0U7_9GAMM|nr:metal ABC transporter permease [Salinicola acroporae]MDH4571137.1 metal ABC transporter permease [Salinicola acroporae]
MPAIHATRALRMVLFGLTVGCFAASALAAQNAPNHLRGTITAVDDDGITVESLTDGSSHRVTIGDDTRLAAVSKSSLDEIAEGTFIGTANMPGEDGQPATALEMVIFPESMNGTGEGDYPWDMPRGATEGGSGGEKLGGSGSGSTMTNGTVSATDSGGKMGGASSGSTMTNGTVNRAADEDGMMTLTVDYGDGSKQIRVPSDIPTVKVSKGSMDDLKQDAAVFVAGDITQDPIEAKAVIVGRDGTVPPM